MSLHTVGTVIDKLLNEEDLRIRLALDRLETLAELSVRGLEMTSEEMDLFMRTDVRLWFQGFVAAGECVH